MIIWCIVFRFFQAFDKNNVEKDVAESIKKEFDKKHGPTWHCIVGRNFGIFFSLIFLTVLLTENSQILVR